VAKYTVFLKASAAKELNGLAASTFLRVDKKILELGDNPRPAGCKKLRGQRDLWRIRVGDYRVVYSIDDSELAVEILRVRNRKDSYE
jgi:mRNA interferase RelE/StbE